MTKTEWNSQVHVECK